MVMLAFSLASCAQPLVTSTATPSPPPCPAQAASSQTGSISGQLGFPADVILPMTIYAIPVTAVQASSVRGHADCFQTVQTVFNQTTYHLLDLPPGNYYVLATTASVVEWRSASDSRVGNPEKYFGGAYTKYVACGLGYTCTDHALLPVNVQAGQVTAGIAMTDWYADQGTYPMVPANAAQPVTLAPEPAAFSSAMDAAVYYTQLTTGGKYVQATCPVNRACVSVGSVHNGVNSAYFLGSAGSNTDLLSCGAYVWFDTPTSWHNADVVCKAHSPNFPSIGASGAVSGFMGDTGCVHVRQTAGRTGVIAGCLALGTAVTVDGGPVFVNEPDPSLGPSDRLWWHLQGRG